MGIMVDALKRWFGFGFVQVEEKDDDMCYVSVDLVNECMFLREEVKRLKAENKELEDYCNGLEQSLDAAHQQVEYLNTQLNDEIPEIDKIESKPWSEL